MADFRISLPDEDDGLNRRELDWDRELGAWTLSEQEYGSSRWELGLPASAWDLGQVMVFFRMVDPVREEILARMSPGECVVAHRTQTQTADLLGDLCPDCGDHWLVYRLEDGDQWRLYGRTCDYAWHRGRRVEPDGDGMLTALIQGSAIA